MDKLSPGARATLFALRDQPGNVHEIAERTGRSRSGTDKALRELAKADLIGKVDGGDPADGAPARWQHTDGAAVAAELNARRAEPVGPEPGSPHGDEPTEPATVVGESGGEPPADLGTGPDAPAPAETAPAGSDDDQSESSVAGAAGGDPDPPEADEPKICRGCGEQLPRVCPHCWQKTPSYCGKCRKDMPQGRRGEPGEPSILPSGLPRLRPGELEQLVVNVLQQQPLPNHVGITGWTAQRVAIYLPGRSTGAIGNALSKLTKTGQVELLGEQPMRYQLTAAAMEAAERQQHEIHPDGTDAEQVQPGGGADQPPADDR